MKRWLIVTAALMALAGLYVPMAAASMIAGAQPAMAQDDAKKAEVEAYKAWYDVRTDVPKALDPAKAYVQKFPNGQYADYLKKWIVGARGTLFNQAMKAAADLTTQAGATNDPAARNALASQVGKEVAKMIQLGNEALAENPNDLDYLFLLAYALRQNELYANPRNFSHASEAADYSSRAIRLIEDGKVPAVVAKDKFSKNVTLSALYQNLAVVEANKRNTDKALEYYSKAASLDPSDPSSYFACGQMHQTKYQAAAAKYQGIPEADRNAAEPKPEVKAALDDVNKEADAVIDCWARFMAVSANNAAYGPTRTQVNGVLTDLYKYRHPDSPDGLQKLIDQYKAQAGAPSAGNTASANTSHN